MDTFDPVARTCLLTTALRAQESRRPDRLYEDPYAERLAQAVGRELLGRVDETSGPGNGGDGPAPSTVDYNAIRTRFLDDHLLRSMASGDLTQLVMIAAGMDTRAHRLPWPSDFDLYEVDQPAVLRAKETVLGAEPPPERVTRHAVAADLRDGDWTGRLTAAGYRPELPSLWLVEGLTYYLPEPQLRQLLRTMREMTAPGSVVAADLVNAVTLTDPASKPLLDVFRQLGCPWVFGHDEPEALFAEYGVDATAVQPGEPGADHGRWSLPVRPRHVPGVARAFLVTGTRTAR